MNTDVENIRAQLAQPKNIVLFTHRNPDGDAIGSSLGLAHFLKELGHSPTAVFPSEYPNVFSYLHGLEESLIWDNHAGEVKDRLKVADLIFLLDFNGLDRIDTLGPLVGDSEAFKIMIDHHIDPEPCADIIISDTGASSTCEMVFKLIDELGGLDKLTHFAAEALFTGIVTDTGSFRYGTNPYTYEVAGALKSMGVDDYFLQNRIFNSLTEKQLKLIGHCIANRMEIMKEYRTAFMHLTKQDYKDFSIQRGDTEGIVNYMLMMRHIRIAAFITEQNQYVKLSFRSKGNISVQELARDHFNGGGHRNASGGQTTEGLESTIARFKEVLPEYLHKQGFLI